MIWKTLKYIFGSLCAIGILAILFNEYLIGIILLMGFALLFTIASICEYLYEIKENTSKINDYIKNIYNELINNENDYYYDDDDDDDDEKKQEYKDNLNK